MTRLSVLLPVLDPDRLRKDQPTLMTRSRTADHEPLAIYYDPLPRLPEAERVRLGGEPDAGACFLAAPDRGARWGYLSTVQVAEVLRVLPEIEMSHICTLVSMARAARKLSPQHVALAAYAGFPRLPVEVWRGGQPVTLSGALASPERHALWFSDLAWVADLLVRHQFTVRLAPDVWQRTPGPGHEPSIATLHGGGWTSADYQDLRGAVSSLSKASQVQVNA